MDLGIRNKRVLITGGSKGIGVATARAFAREGCRVALIARYENELNKVIEELGGTIKGHEFLAIDLLKPGAPSNAVKELIKRNGPFDIAIHNVGGGLGVKGPLGDVEDWLKVWQFNVGIAIEMNALLIPPMKEKMWGRIVHISALAGVTGGAMVHPYGGALPYACAKSYLNMYTKTLGREFAKDNVIITALMPGAILSKGKHWDKLQKIKPEVVEEYLHQYYATGRFGKAEEMAPFILMLASEHASFAAGAIVPVDGGAL